MQEGKLSSVVLVAGAALMCTFGFVVAASWIAAIADELVAMLQFFGYLSGVDSAVLGLTVLAWGNSVGDLSTNVSMAKRLSGTLLAAIRLSTTMPILSVIYVACLRVFD